MIDELSKLEQQFMHVLDGWEEDSSSPAAVSALQYALGAVRDAMHRSRSHAPAQTPLDACTQAELDAFSGLDGSGYSNHPDSGEICNACGGQGGIKPRIRISAPSVRITWTQYALNYMDPKKEEVAITTLCRAEAKCTGSFRRDRTATGNGDGPRRDER